uniref:SCP-2 sterol transfer family protein n=1 Tax=Candidatus Kentrum sp. MB TaxID=2138164 RepID=A0A450Y295_9GAMM|nr:MAG: hypothetical protein BECKMB1821G_GA0114241_102310 [Candidatus Kentron sp. MB]VFK35654.1 MAG: hypothetical protein BECKMB1821I_GA0114274_11352 [Candidatus Kentron sp. MB]VFK77456.1 MAG: hypothetical protein BECKMB1821H_GA0114242_11422 [Candidatus Kentron sp. MB]
MADLFSEDWMKGYMDEWNKEPELADALAKINFCSKIAYGFLDEDKARGLLIVEDGKVTSAKAYDDSDVNWDLRASKESWEKWLEKGLGMASLGAAYVGGKLKFKTGDYSAMIKDPRMAGPFVRSFTVMGRVNV